MAIMRGNQAGRQRCFESPNTRSLARKVIYFFYFYFYFYLYLYLYFYFFFFFLLLIARTLFTVCVAALKTKSLALPTSRVHARTQHH